LVEPVSDAPTVSIVISHINSARTIGNCLANLSQVDYPSDRYEVIVVDAGSTDGSIDIVTKRNRNRVRQIVEPGCSESQGQSIGVQRSKGEVVMFTNSDIYVPHDWIRRHIEWQRKGYDLVGGAVFWGGDKFSLTWNQVLPRGACYSAQPGMGLGFSNCSMTRSFFTKVGGLRNLNSQHDAEFTLRAIQLGGRLVLDPKIEVYHDHPFKSFLANFKRSFGYAINHVTVIKSIFGKIVAGSGKPVYIPASSVVREVALVAGAQTYLSLRTRARKWHAGVEVGPLEFIFIRVFSTKLGQLAGIAAGALARKVTLARVKELHSSRAIGPGAPNLGPEIV